MVRALRAVPGPVFLIVLIGLSGAELGRIYAGPLLAQLMLGAAVGSVAVSVAARRMPSWLVAPLSVLAMVAYTVLALRFAARRADLTGGLTEMMVEAVQNGIPRLLTALIPVEPVPDTVLVPVVTVWLTGLAAAELALRARRTLLGYLPPTLLYAGCLYVVGPNAEPAVWPTVAFATVAMLGLAVASRTGRAGHGWSGYPTSASPATKASSMSAEWFVGPVPISVRVRLSAGTAAGVVLLLTLTVVVAPLVAGQVRHAPTDPRRYLRPPVVDSLDENPLTRISGWALNPGQTLFDVRTVREATKTDPVDDSGSAGGPDVDGTEGAEGTDDGRNADIGTRIRLAVLPDYDGVTWRVGATYRNTGRVLPDATRHPDARVDTVRQEITIAELTGRLLPVVPTPQRVTGTRVAYDPDSGTLIRPEGLAPGLRYTVTSIRERPNLNVLTTAEVPAGAAVARVLRLNAGVPERLRQLAGELSAENGAPYERALAVEQFLAEHYRLVADAPSGHAYPNLSFFLFGPRHAGGQQGTSEQFSAAFAVLGRLMGLPTRVVVGFHSATGDGPVRGADAYAWPEVLFNGLGWVAFDPLPRSDTVPRPVEEDFKPKPDPPMPPSPSAQPQPSATPTAAAVTDAAAPARRSRGLVPLVAVGGVGLLVLMVAGFALTVVGLRHAQRRRRLDTGTPAQRVTGAWLETLDALRLAGRPPGVHLSATEVAAHAADIAARAPAMRIPAPPIDEVTALVNLAGFAPAETTEEQARTAGARAMAYVSALRHARPWWRRLLWSVHPGPLRWHR